MITNLNIIAEYNVDSIYDFATQFDLKELICSDYEIEEINDIFEHENFSSDQEIIEEYLEKDSRFFIIDFRTSKECKDGFWNIKELQYQVSMNQLFKINKLYKEIRDLIPNSNPLKRYELKCQKKVVDSLLSNSGKLIYRLENLKEKELARIELETRKDRYEKRKESDEVFCSGCSQEVVLDNMYNCTDCGKFLG